MLEVALDPDAVESSRYRDTNAQILESLEPPEQRTHPKLESKDAVDVDLGPLVTPPAYIDVDDEEIASEGVDNDSDRHTNGEPLLHAVLVA